MSKVIRTSLVRIGNSQGIRIPKVILDQLALTDLIELEVRDNQLLVRAGRTARADWAAQFQKMAEYQDDRLLDAEIDLTNWEETEWEW